jgi:signal transduction histidine kinase
MTRRWRSSRDRVTGLLMLTGLAAYVVAVYVVVVLGGGVLAGATAAPHVALSVLATAVVALSFERVQAWVERRAVRLVHGGRPSPYEVLSRFTETVTGAYRSEEVPSRMAKLVAEATGAPWAQVAVAVGGRLVPAATWPPHEAVAATARRSHGEAADLSVPVSHAGEFLGELRVAARGRTPLTPVEENLLAGLAGQAGLVLRGVRLRVELEERLAELSVRAEELRVSRERLVEAQDAERRTLERDIHDGAQQHLVALAVNLRLAQTLARRSPERAARVLADQATAARVAVETLRGLSRGIYPRLLGEAGLAAALRAAAGAGPLRVDVTDHGIGRVPPDVAAAVYFCCLEALQNAAKHSGAGRVTLDLSRDGDHLVAVVADDGRGFDVDTLAGGAGLANMRDRIDAVGGTLDLATPPAGGTLVRARVPLAPVATGAPVASARGEA